MKKIMKKAFGLMLALVMVLSLMPVTVKAAETLNADGTVSRFAYNGFDDCKYLYTPEVDGTLSIEFDYYDWTCWIYEGETLNMSSVQVAYGDAEELMGAGKSNKVTASVKAGQAYLVVIRLYSAGDSMFIASFMEGSEESAGLDGSGTYGDPYIVSDGSAIPALGYGESAYCAYKGENSKSYSIAVTGSGMMDCFNLVGISSTVETSAMMGMANATISPYASGAVIFLIANTNLGDGGPYTISINEVSQSSSSVGTEDDPDTLPIGENTQIELIANARGSYLYYYTWTATDTGKLTITTYPRMCTGNNWMYSVSGGEWDAILPSSANGDSVIGEYYVKAGEEIKVWFAMPDYSAGSVAFGATFETCKYPTIEKDDFTEYKNDSDKLVYMIYNTDLVDVGSFTVPVSEENVPTLYTFKSVSAGYYTATVSNGQIAYYASSTTLLNGKETPTTADFTISADGQPAVLGVSGATDEEVVITITKIADYEESTVTYKLYWFDGATPEAYKFTGDLDSLEYVDVEDDIIDAAVLGADGYYHLNRVDGPILYVDLEGVYGSYNVAALAENDVLYGKNVDGVVNSYGDLYNFYVGLTDDSGLYPLTADLMLIYQDVLAGQWWNNTGIYGDDALTAADGWMFNCAYIPNAVELVVPADKVVTEEALEAAIEEAIEKNLPLVVETTEEGVTLTFAVEDLKDAEAVKLNVEVKLNTDVKDETVAKAEEITEKNFVLKIEFSHDGALPAKATITIPVGADYANKTLYYYEILADGTLKYVCDAPVDANGVAKVTQDHCSDYVLLTEKIADTTGTTGTVAPGGTTTGDATNIALWVAVLGLGVVAIVGSVVMKKRKF